MILALMDFIIQFFLTVKRWQYRHNKSPDQFYSIISSYQSRHEYIYLRMFQGDPLSIETHLNNDWSLLLRNLKTKEDHHFELLQYNHQIINQVRDSQAELFVNDEILQHQKVLVKITESVDCIQREEKFVYDKYEGYWVQEERAIKLMSRVGARIFQIYQASIDKCKGFDAGLNDRYLKIRKTLVQLLNRSDGIYLEEIVKCIANYSKEKLQIQMEKLKKMISAIENGEFFKLKEIYTPKERKGVRSVQRKIDVLRDLSKTKAEKQSTKTDQKQQQKQKRQKQKMMNNLYSTMQLSKQQFNDDEGIQAKVKIEKLYNEILARNRYNSQQIEEFQAKREFYEERLKTFSQYIEKEGKKVAEVFVRRPVKKDKAADPQLNAQKQCIAIETQQTCSNQQAKNNSQNIMTEGNIDSQLKKQKKKMNTQQFKLKSISTKKDINDLPSLLNSFLSTNQNFSNFKFEQSNRQLYTRTGRNIFPDIGKGTSLDQKTQITKIKIDKILRTTIKNDDKIPESNQRKYQNSRKTAIINRQEAKLIEETQKIRMNIRHIDFGFDSALKRGDRQRIRFNNDSEGYSLNVKKAEIKIYEPRPNLIF